MTDELSKRYDQLLTGAYDCVDRIVLNAYFALGHNPGGFRSWWRRLHDGCEAQLDNTHLMRMAGRFSRRVRAWATANQIPVIDCGRGERKHLIAEECLATHTVGAGAFLILVARAMAPVWEVSRSAGGVIGNLAKKKAFVNHYSLAHHGSRVGTSDDQAVGASAVRRPDHPQRSRVGRLPGAGGRDRLYEGGQLLHAHCRPAALAQVADTLSQPATIGHLRQVCDRWIYSACLCFGLGLAEQHSGFRYEYSVYQAEYSRNLLFKVGGQMDRVFNTMVDRTRSRLDVPTLRTLFGAKHRPHQDRATRCARAGRRDRETSVGPDMVQVRFGLLTLKGYTKGEHVLRFEATVHNTRDLGCGRVLEKFPEIIGRLAGMAERFCTTLDCVDVGFLTDQTLDELPRSSQLGRTRVGGIDLNKPRIRAVLAAVLVLATTPRGLHRRRAHRQGPADDRADRDRLHDPPGRRRPTQAPRQAPHRQTGPVAALPGPAHRYPHDRGPARPARPGHRPHSRRCPQPPDRGRKPVHWTRIDRDYETLCIGMQALFADLGITTSAAA